MSPVLRIAVPIAGIAALLVGGLTLALFDDASERLASLGGPPDDMVRVWASLAASSCLLLAAFMTWRVHRGLAPLQRSADRMEAKLGAALEREREFSGHVAHELRTPLTVLQTGLELARRKQTPGTDAHAQLDELLGTVEEMRRLTENLLLLARVERGAEATQLEPVLVRPLVDGIWRRLADKAARRDLTFDNALPEEHRIQADRGKLHIVVQNLLANAVSYTDPGGSIVVDGDAVDQLRIWDSGPQLSPEHLTRMFDRLWRADMARTDATQHAGLGLSLARALCRHMQLELSAENVESGGLRFVIRTLTRSARW